MVINSTRRRSAGARAFPDIPLEVCAVAGKAVFFVYDTPDVRSRRLHCEAPVGEARSGRP